MNCHSIEKWYISRKILNNQQKGAERLPPERVERKKGGNMKDYLLKERFETIKAMERKRLEMQEAIALNDFESADKCEREWHELFGKCQALKEIYDTLN